jgi:hypothetical protein
LPPRQKHTNKPAEGITATMGVLHCSISLEQ